MKVFLNEKRLPFSDTEGELNELHRKAMAEGKTFAAFSDDFSAEDIEGFFEGKPKFRKTIICSWTKGKYVPLSAGTQKRYDRPKPFLEKLQQFQKEGKKTFFGFDGVFNKAAKSEFHRKEWDFSPLNAYVCEATVDKTDGGYSLSPTGEIYGFGTPDFASAKVQQRKLDKPTLLCITALNKGELQARIAKRKVFLDVTPDFNTAWTVSDDTNQIYGAMDRAVENIILWVKLQSKGDVVAKTGSLIFMFRKSLLKLIK